MGHGWKTVMCILASVILVFTHGCMSDRKESYIPGQKKVKLGVEVFLEKHLSLVKEKKVGLVTNPTGVDSQLRSTIDLFCRSPEIELVALYGPEHGVRGDAQAGEYVPFYFEEKYKIPVFSLYGQSKKPVPGMIENIDQYMRAFDTQIEGKFPEDAMVGSLDVMIFDIQDVGTRIYTYIATMAYCMEACAQNNIKFIVLDRPNPINGRDIEGPILEYPEYSSFVGLFPIPVRHGMTVGELAKLFNDRFLTEKADLTVIPMEGWERRMWHDETSLPWIIPSPNIPSFQTANIYPGQVFLEGTNLSEGRGTTKPFEVFGAPWIDAYELTKRLNELHLPGVAFRNAWFRPFFSKYQGESCGGAQIHVLDRNLYKPFESTLHVIHAIRDLYPDEFRFHEQYFDRITGTAEVREALARGDEVKDIIKKYRSELDKFSEIRKPYLLY